VSRKTFKIGDRKLDGIYLPLKEDVQARGATTLLEDMTLVHNALPELDIEDIDTSASFLNHIFSAPLIIDAMTGGTKEAAKINANLAIAAQELGLGMGVGSQRAALESADVAETYSVARKNAPTAFIVANIGGAQIRELKIKEILRIIKMVNADAIAIHLNPLQELVQPEGEPRFRGILERISRISSQLDTPIIVKEVGCGISHEVATKLEVAGVSAINVAGLGGTSWAAIEHYRARAEKLEGKAALGQLFWDWGIPTAASIIEVKRAVKLPVIASGGLRTGLDVVKCIALGADLAGLAHPVLAAAMKSDKAVLDILRRVLDEVRAAMFLTGAQDIRSLGGVRYIITGRLAEWKDMR
jgi:isopentenyl-diphosphate delta-isomerase